MPNPSDDDRRINAIRFLAVDAVQKANSGHPGLPLGAAAVAYVLWTRYLKHSPRNPKWFDRDRFVLSAGHGSALLYALLYLTGYPLSMEEVMRFRQLDSKTPGHPENHVTAGVEVTTGPLGQGVGNAVGLAIAEAHLAAKLNRDDHPIVDHFTYCVAGDGDMMEGVASEASSLAGHLKLGKLVMLYDDNHVSLAGPTSVTFTEDVGARYEAYGWHVQRVTDGNDLAAVDAAIAQARQVTDQPSLIITTTHIGFGSPVQDTYKAHGEPLGPDGVKATKEKLGWPTEPAFLVPDDVLSFFREAQRTGAAAEAEWQRRFDGWRAAYGDLAADFERALRAELPPGLKWPTFDKNNGAIATRDAGGTIMNAIAAQVTELIGGSADLDPSTKTYLKDCGDFEFGSHGGRNVHFGVREHAMGAALNGMAHHGGLLPFGATFFNFTDYMKPAMRLAALSHARVIYVMTHDSIFLGEDGPTHQPIEQLATLRATPDMLVIRPADAVETVEAWKIALQPRDGPCTLVLTRQKVPYLGDGPRDVARGAYILHDTEGAPDVLLIGTGSEVALVLGAAEALAKRGVRARVVSMPSWELFRAQDVAYRDRVLPPAVRARVSVEAGATLGWSEWIGPQGVAIGMSGYGASAPAADVAKKYHFTVEHVTEVAAGLLADRD